MVQLLSSILPSSQQISNDLARAKEQKIDINNAINKQPHTGESKPKYTPNSREKEVYEAYNLEKGFSKTYSQADLVEISPLAKELYTAVKNREMLGENAYKIMEKGYQFNGIIQEAYSPGGAVFRAINTDMLNSITRVEDALLLYDYINQPRKNGMTITDSDQMVAVTARVAELIREEKDRLTFGVLELASDLYDQKETFMKELAEIDPSLAGKTFEFRLEGDTFKITPLPGKNNDLTERQIKLIEDLANNGNHGAEKLVNTMKAIRDFSVEYYNRWNSHGQTNPITEKDFDDRFGGFHGYLETFRFAAGERGKNGPDGEGMYRAAYFSGAMGYAQNRL